MWLLGRIIYWCLLYQITGANYLICRHFKIRHILSVLQALLYTFWARIIYILSRSPPYHKNVVPRKMLKKRVADFFLLFLNMWMECWRLLFAVKYHLVWPGEGKSVQNWPSFIRGDPVGSNRKAKWLAQIVASFNILHITFGVFLCCNILVSARFGVGNHFLGQGY